MLDTRSRYFASYDSDPLDRRCETRLSAELTRSSPSLAVNRGTSWTTNARNARRCGLRRMWKRTSCGRHFWRTGAAEAINNSRLYFACVFSGVGPPSVQACWLHCLLKIQVTKDVRRDRQGSFKCHGCCLTSLVGQGPLRTRCNTSIACGDKPLLQLSHTLTA